MVVDVFVKVIVVKEIVVIKIADVVPDEVQYVVSETIFLGDLGGYSTIIFSQAEQLSPPRRAPVARQ